MPESSHTPGHKKPPVTWTQIALFAIAIIVAFIAGTRSDYIVATLTGKNQSDELNLSEVQQVYRVLAENFDGTLDTDALISGAKKGLVEAVEDPYTVYFTPEEAQEFLGDLAGTFEGIGAELGKDGDSLIVVNPLKGSPAEKAGLKAGDRIIAVNGDDTIGWSIEEAVSKIRGEEGTTVKLGIVRDNTPQDISIVRGTITVPSVETEITEDNIGVIRISRFAQTETTALVRQAANEFVQKGVKGVVVDLRGNGGGYLQASVDIASLWMEDKVVVTERSGGEVRDTLKTSGPTPLEGIKTVVLINGGSASASEIVAGALRDNKVATLVGEQTFGKGVVQDIKKLPDGGSLKVTIASWYTPNGNNINEEGLAPDVEVTLSEKDIEQEKDPQFEKALELLK